MKMCLETAQILCTVSHLNNVKAPYKPTHKNHPSVLWANKSLDHWSWLANHGMAIGNEFEKRRHKGHASTQVIKWCIDYGGRPTTKGYIPPPTCMPEHCKLNISDIESYTVESYRNYYLLEKSSFATWQSTPPAWWNNNLVKCNQCTTWASDQAISKWKNLVCPTCQKKRK